MSARGAGKTCKTVRALALIVALCTAWSGLAAGQTPAPPAPASTPPAPSPAPKTSSTPSDKDLAQPTLRDDKDVIDASERWLKLLDEGHLGTAWDNAAPLLKSAVTRDKWIVGIRDARKPFGKVKTRSADKFARAHELPGAPEGDYALVAFRTQFANGRNAEEQITWQLGPQDTWRVSGYFIR